MRTWLIAAGALGVGLVAGFFIGREFPSNGQPDSGPGPANDAGASARSRNRPLVNAFMRAARKGQAGGLEQMLKEGVNVNDKDSDGQTALMHASTRGQLSIVKLLLDHKALIADQDNLGQTAVIKAAKNGHHAVIVLFRDRHQESEQHNTVYQALAVRDKEGRSALTYAAMQGHAEIVSFLLHFTLADDVNDPSVRDKYGKTAIMHAAERGHAGVVRAMLTGFPTKASPAYVALKDKKGKTARQLAEAKGHKAVVELLAK